ncbi:NPCBM/NEW2 domain-containing protein [Actinosynnema sp. NPDC059797]
MTDRETLDPAIQAARINRRGAVVAAVVAALITGTATGVSAYFAGREEGGATASTVTVVHTETVTESAADPAGRNSRPGSKSLLELNPVEASGTIVTDPQRVDTEDYQRAITAWLGTCGGSGALASRTYHLDRRYERLRTGVGLGDGSKSGRSVEFSVFVDETRIDSATAQVGLGQVRNLDVDVTNALRVRLEARFLGGTCFDEYQAGAVWVEPTIE